MSDGQNVLKQEVGPTIKVDKGNAEDSTIANTAQASVRGSIDSKIISPDSTSLRMDDMRISNPMEGLRSAYRSLADIRSKNLNANFTAYMRGLRANFVHPNPRPLNYFTNNVFHVIFYQYNKVYGLLRALRMVRVDAFNNRVLNFFDAYFRSFRIDDQQMLNSINFMDVRNIFMDRLDKMKL